MAIDPSSVAKSIPRQRLILLGASNLTRGLSTVVNTAQHLFGTPLEMHFALGHGRSYGRKSRVIARSLPGIVDCAIWSAIENDPLALPTAALMTDIGNDLFYGATVDQIVSWIESCISKLSARHARVAISMLPLMNLDWVSPRQFYFLQTVFFPRRGIEFETFCQRARQLDARLRTLASAQQLAIVEPRAAWYGWDPIHLRAREWREAWQTLLAPLVANDDPAADANIAFSPQKTAGFRLWLYLRSRAPHERGLFGFTQRRAQPAGRLATGTTIALY